MTADRSHRSVLYSLIPHSPARSFGWASIDCRFETTAEIIAVSVTCSTTRLITDIWRTESGPSERCGAPLAVADRDGLRPPAVTANAKGLDAAASAYAPAWPRRVPLRPLKRATAVRCRPEHDLDGQTARLARDGRARPAPTPPLPSDDQPGLHGNIGHAT